MTTIFLCHASEDKPIAEPIQLALSSAGYEVFYDQYSLPPGGDYHDRIFRAIMQCDLFIFLISEASIAQGKYTLTELTFARNKWPSPTNRVLPVNLESIPTRDIPQYLTAATVLSVKGSPAAEVRQSAEALLNMQRGKRRRLWFALAAALGSIALTVLFIVFQNQGSDPALEPIENADSAEPRGPLPAHGSVKIRCFVRCA